MIDILIADNQVLTREGVRSTLADIVDINISAIAAYIADLELLIFKHKPQVLLIDPYYDHRFTIDDIKNIRLKYDTVRLIILSNKQNRDEINELMNLGIKNHVFKECSREELVHAIYSAAKSEQFFCKRTFETLFGSKLLPEKDTTLPQLSLRETELIHLISEGLTNKEIAERLFLSVHTIKTHRKNIIKKLGFTFKNTTELASLFQKR